LDDVEAIAAQVLKYFKPIEVKEHVPKEDDRFGYFGLHYMLLVPSDVIIEGVDEHLMPPFFELQIKTLYQHAWAEANHDLAYKPAQPLTNAQRRKVAFTAAQSWGADLIFNELQRELTTVN
jgi:ppGpp synthetase/RelA/SpoT-type nucleotidyltranferase